MNKGNEIDTVLRILARFLKIIFKCRAPSASSKSQRTRLKTAAWGGDFSISSSFKKTRNLNQLQLSDFPLHFNKNPSVWIPLGFSNPALPRQPCEPWRLTTLNRKIFELYIISSLSIIEMFQIYGGKDLTNYSILTLVDFEFVRHLENWASVVSCQRNGDIWVSHKWPT